MKTLTETIEFLDEVISNANFDIQQDWLSIQDRTEMQNQLQLILIARANLQLLASRPKSQIFNSSITL